MAAHEVGRTDGLALPEVVGRYQDAHDRRDTDAALSAFASDVVNHLEGNFPGGVVDLRYQFVMNGARIAELVIAP